MQKKFDRYKADTQVELINNQAAMKKLQKNIDEKTKENYELMKSMKEVSRVSIGSPNLQNKISQ